MMVAKKLIEQKDETIKDLEDEIYKMKVDCMKLTEPTKTYMPSTVLLEENEKAPHCTSKNCIIT